MTVWRAGAHLLISPDDWPDLLPEIVLGAVRRAPLVNGDPLMRDLRDDGNQSCSGHRLRDSEVDVG
jgi:hypothetical protein